MGPKVPIRRRSILGSLIERVYHNQLDGGRAIGRLQVRHALFKARPRNLFDRLRGARRLTWKFNKANTSTKLARNLASMAGVMRRRQPAHRCRVAASATQRLGSQWRC